MAYDINGVLATPGKLKNYGGGDWILMLAEAVEAGLGMEFAKLLNLNAPQAISWISMAHPASLHPIKELFVDDALPDQPARLHPEMTLTAAVKELDAIAASGKIFDEPVRRQMLSRFASYLSKDQWDVMRMIIRQDIPQPLVDFVWEKVQELDFAIAAYGHFFKCLDIATIVPDTLPDTIFSGPDGAEVVHLLPGPIELWSNWGSAWFRYDPATGAKTLAWPGDGHDAGLVSRLQAIKRSTDIHRSVSQVFVCSGGKVWAEIHDVRRGTPDGMLVPGSMSMLLPSHYNAQGIRPPRRWLEHTLNLELGGSRPKAAIFWNIPGFAAPRLLHGPGFAEDVVVEYVLPPQLIPFDMFGGKYGMLMGDTAENTNVRVHGPVKALEEVPAVPGIQVQAIRYFGRLLVLSQ